jgi:hypothetical protein
VIAAPMPSPETENISKPRSEVQTLDSLARLASQCRQRGAPSEVSPKQLRELHIRVVKTE